MNPEAALIESFVRIWQVIGGVEELRIARLLGVESYAILSQRIKGRDTRIDDLREFCCVQPGGTGEAVFSQLMERWAEHCAVAMVRHAESLTHGQLTLH